MIAYWKVVIADGSSKVENWHSLAYIIRFVFNFYQNKYFFIVLLSN